MTVIDDRLRASQQLIIDVYRSYRDKLLESYGRIDFELKSDQSQVTELDIEVEQTLRLKLQETYPEYGFQGEETGKIGNTEQFWLVDPIDGTTSFVRGVPNCTNMAAFIVGRQPVAAVIYNFVEDELYTAILGEGAFKNGQPIHVSNRDIAESAVDNISSSIYADLQMVLRPHGIRMLQPLGAMGRSFSLVAEGKLDAALIINTLAATHDRAPGALIIREAGGKIVSFEGDVWDIDTKNFAVGNARIVEFLKTKAQDIKQIIQARS